MGSFESVRFRRHADRGGFALALARDDRGRPVGFAYGMTGLAESWWSDYLRARIDPDLVDHWIPGAFELTELAVLPEARGVGTGRDLLDVLLASRKEDRVVCQTLDQETPARHLYRSLGFRDLAPVGEAMLLGRELPIG